jgi:hypothetical protein
MSNNNNNNNSEIPIYQCLGIAILFIGFVMRSMAVGYREPWACGITFILLGGLFNLLSALSAITSGRFIKYLGTAFGFTGFLFIALIFLSVNYPSLESFYSPPQLFLGIGFMVVAGFIFFPPNMGRLSNEIKGENKENNAALSIMKTTNSSANLTQTSGNESDDNMIDRMLSDIMNANTNLDELSRTNPNLASKIQSTFNYYDPNAGVFSSWAKRIRGESRAKLIEVLNKEQQLLIEQAVLFEEKVREGAKSQVEFRMFLAQNALQLIELRTKAKLNAKAFQKEMLPEDWSRVRTEQEFLDIRLKEEEARARREDLQEQERLKRQLQAEEEKYLRDKKAEDERITRNLESARAYKMTEHTITDDYRNKMVKALIEIDEIEARTDISDRTKAALKIAKENEAENLRRIIAARERKAQSDEESFL